MAGMMDQSKNGPRKAQSDEVSKGVDGKPMTTKVKDIVIGTEKPKKVSKSPWKCRIGMGQRCLRKESGPRMP